MAELQGEIPNRIISAQEMPGAFAENAESLSDRFIATATENLATLRQAAGIIIEDNKSGGNPRELRQAEQVYKEASLELYFRKHTEARSEYTGWLELKRSKQQQWENLMRTKYGTDWKKHVTKADRGLLTFTAEEMQLYERHKAIEEKAMKDENLTKSKKDKKDKERGKKEDFFKLVKAQTLLEFPFLGEREVHKAVYSIDFLFFYMKLQAGSAIRKGFNQMRGKEIAEYAEFVRKLHAGVNFAKELAILNRMKPMNRFFNSAVATH